eukprot:tig00000940_g5546.t1
MASPVSEAEGWRAALESLEGRVLRLELLVDRMRTSAFLGPPAGAGAPAAAGPAQLQSAFDQLREVYRGRAREVTTAPLGATAAAPVPVPVPDPRMPGGAAAAARPTSAGGGAAGSTSGEPLERPAAAGGTLRRRPKSADAARAARAEAAGPGAGLAEAGAELRRAARALRALDKAALAELRARTPGPSHRSPRPLTQHFAPLQSFKEPPLAVKAVTEAACGLLLGLGAPDWAAARRLLASPTFAAVVANFDAGSLTPALARRLRKQLESPFLQPESVARVRPYPDRGLPLR